MPGSQPTLADLRPGLDHALAMARTWEKEHDVALPGRIQELVNSRRRSLPTNWAATMRAALELSAGFRAEVATTATEESVGRVSWLWLERPDGWAKEVAALVESSPRAIQQEKDERTAKDRLSITERKLVRAERDLDRLNVVNSELTSEVARIRQARLAADTRADRADVVARDAAESIKRLEGRVDGLQRDGAASSRRYDRLQADLDAATERLTQAESARRSAESRLEETEIRVGEAVAMAAKRADELAALRAEVAAKLSEAMAAVDQITPALASAVEALAINDGQDAPGRPQPARPSAGRRSTLRPGPLALPPGLFDDSVEAVEFLLRVPGVQLVVDGYNVALTSWPVTDLPALRDRLVSALAELALRLRISILVVFDGAGDGGRSAPPRAARPYLTVLFSASNVEADEEIVLAAGRLGAIAPVVVATDDRAVRDAARHRTANVISVAQLLTELNRHTPLR